VGVNLSKVSVDMSVGLEPDKLQWAVDFRERVILNMGRFADHRRDLVDLLLICLANSAPILLEGKAGTGKTSLFTSFSRCFKGFFSRISLSTDLFPQDLMGYERRDFDGGISIQPGPIFSHFLLLDNINLATPRTVSALINVLQGEGILIGSETLSQLTPFLACATRTELFQDETSYNLSVLQLDQFMLSSSLDYPTFDQQIHFLTLGELDIRQISPTIDLPDVIKLQTLARLISVDIAIVSTIAEIAAATREGSAARSLSSGLSSRAASMFKRATQARALLNGRNRVTTEDLRVLASPLMRHRLDLTFAARAEGESADQIISRILADVF
jgi:MoxR-like ATPase